MEKRIVYVNQLKNDIILEINDEFEKVAKENNLFPSQKELDYEIEQNMNYSKIRDLSDTIDIDKIMKKHGIKY